MILGKYRRVFTTDIATTSFTAKTPTATEPSGDGVFSIGEYGSINSVCQMKFVFFGQGDENDVFEARIIGWAPVGVGTQTVWMPTILGAFTCTLSTAVGVAGGIVDASDKFVDTIAGATIPVEPTIAADVTRLGTITISSPANNLIGFVVMPTWGFGLFEMTADMTTNDPTGANALVAFI